MFAASRPVTPPKSPSAMGRAKFWMNEAMRNWREAMTKAPGRALPIQKSSWEGKGRERGREDEVIGYQIRQSLRRGGGKKEVQKEEDMKRI